MRLRGSGPTTLTLTPPPRGVGTRCRRLSRPWAAQHQPTPQCHFRFRRQRQLEHHHPPEHHQGPRPTTSVQVYCVGFGQDINTNALEQIASASGGASYTGQTAADLAGRVCPDRQGVHRALSPALGDAQAVRRSAIHALLFNHLPGLHRLLAHQPLSSSATTCHLELRQHHYHSAHDQLYHQLGLRRTSPTSSISRPITRATYAGNVNLGLLDLQPNSALPAGVSLYANYLPEYIRQFNVHYRLNWPGTVVPATNAG